MQDQLVLTGLEVYVSRPSWGEDKGKTQITGKLRFATNYNEYSSSTTHEIRLTPEVTTKVLALCGEEITKATAAAVREAEQAVTQTLENMARATAALPKPGDDVDADDAEEIPL